MRPITQSYLYKQACLKTIPFVLGVLVVLMIAFAVYVRSVPPGKAKQISSPKTVPNLKADFVQDVVREAEQNAQMKKAQEEEDAAGGGGGGGDHSEDNDMAEEQEEAASETIEL